jgi:hypothetical protein
MMLIRSISMLSIPIPSFPPWTLLLISFLAQGSAEEFPFNIGDLKLFCPESKGGKVWKNVEMNKILYQ